MIKTIGRRCAIIGLGVCCAIPIAVAEELVSFPSTRPNVTLKLLLVPADKPVASVVLFPGGHGALHLSGPRDAPAIGWGKNNFLVRTRAEFARAGLLVAVVDAPSDQSGNTGMLGGFRATGEHAQDIEAAVTYLRRRAGVPVWLVGTSRGTESATNAAARVPGVAGLVLTSTITRSSKHGGGVLSMELEAIRIPVLVVAHEADECDHTPASDAPRIVKRLVNAPRTELKLLRGGDPPKSEACQALSAHGYLGIEQEAVEAIVRFIKAPMQ